MLQSRLFSKTERHAPKDEISRNAQFLIRGGFIHKVMAGVYEYLPLGLRVLDKVNGIIREEINSTGAEELMMSILQNKETWATTERWKTAADIMYQFKDSTGKELGLGWTHEEPLTVVAKHFIQSYADLPKAVYQIQTKFRNEPRAKSGLLRGREFLMKDLYSFHADHKDLDSYYEKVAQAYDRIFKRAGLKARRTLASGGLFSKYSEEFQVLAEAGEDSIFYCEKCAYTANKEVADGLGLKDKCPECGGRVVEGRSIEVGNIFKLGTKFSDAFGLTFRNKDGEEKPVIMASYGIGPGRLLGTIVEVSSDAKGIIWPDTVAPYAVHLLELGDASAKKIYQALQKEGIQVLYDERKIGAGEKFADADLLGMPWRFVVSPKTGQKIEVKERRAEKTRLVSFKEAIKLSKP